MSHKPQRISQMILRAIFFKLNLNTKKNKTLNFSSSQFTVSIKTGMAWWMRARHTENNRKRAEYENIILYQIERVKRTMKVQSRHRKSKNKDRKDLSLIEMLEKFLLEKLKIYQNRKLEKTLFNEKKKKIMTQLTC